MNVNNVISNLPTAAGVTTPNANIGTSLGGAGVGALGYGLGNGLRVEIEGDYRGNSLFQRPREHRSEIGYPRRPAAASGCTARWSMWITTSSTLFPMSCPTLASGLGYQWAHLANFTTSFAGPAEALAPALRTNSTEGQFAVQGIVGAAYDIDAVPGLALAR